MRDPKMLLRIPPDEFIHVVPTYHDIDPHVKKLLRRYPEGMRMQPGIPEIVVYPELRVGAVVKPLLAATPIRDLRSYAILDIVGDNLLLG